MLKVCIICSTLESQGPTNVIYNMLNAYYMSGESDVDFSVITLSEEKENTKILLFESLGINIHCFNLDGAVNTLHHLNDIEQYINERAPDICHSYGLRADVVVSRLKLNSSLKLSSLWNNPFEDYQMFGKLKGYLLARFLVWRYKSFDVVVTCSKHNSMSIKRYGRKSLIIYTGVSPDYFKPLSYAERFKRRKELNINEGNKVFIYIANLIERKNPMALIKAFIKANVAHSILLIMGDGLLMNKCKDLAADNPNIRFLGHQPTTLYYLQISDYYISPSISEGFPTAVLEAMSVGVEPLLSSIIPHKEMMSGASEINFFPINKIDEMANVIKNASHRNITFNYRKYVLDNYTGYTMFNRYKQLYRLMIGHKYS